MTINTINPAACRKIRDAINENLEEIGKELGVTFHAGNASYSDTSVTFKIECVLEGVDKAKENFERDCDLFHLPESTYQAEFKHNGSTWILQGVKPRATKYPILASKKGQDGNYKLPESAITHLKDIPKAEIVDFVPRTKASK